VRVLLVDLEMQWRGGQNQALLLLKGLPARAHAAELIAAKGSALGQRTEAFGIPVHYVSRQLFRVPAARKIRELLRSGKFDLVHANEAHAVTAAWLALWGARASATLPFVISRRVGYPIGKSRFALGRYNRAARIVANSKWVAKQAAACGLLHEKLTVVYEGAEIPLRLSLEQKRAARARWGVAPDAPLLGCVGVLSPDKGQEWLIRALVRVREEFPGAILLLAGDGPCRRRLEALARDLGVGDAVIFAGFVADVESVYAALDVFLLPSFFEALNNSLLAAMAYEIPSIAFNRGALGEIIEHGKSGLLVSGPDGPEISNAIIRLLRDPQFARQLGESGRKRVEQNFSADKMVHGMWHVYEAVLAERARTT
jgi:glycosyltransferase involved in cell wall biosynthesis